HTLDIRRALGERAPYWQDESGRRLIVPLYFQETLEPVSRLEGAAESALGQALENPVFKLISRFLGLLMSSSRLPVNRQREAFQPFDLEQAREGQRGYLPPAHRVSDGYEIYGYNQPATIVGGDYFDYFQNW